MRSELLHASVVFLVVATCALLFSVVAPISPLGVFGAQVVCGSSYVLSIAAFLWWLITPKKGERG